MPTVTPDLGPPVRAAAYAGAQDTPCLPAPGFELLPFDPEEFEDGRVVDEQRRQLGDWARASESSAVPISQPHSVPDGYVLLGVQGLAPAGVVGPVDHVESEWVHRRYSDGRLGEHPFDGRIVVEQFLASAEWLPGIVEEASRLARRDGIEHGALDTYGLDGLWLGGWYQNEVGGGSMWDERVVRLYWQDIDRDTGALVGYRLTAGHEGTYPVRLEELRRMAASLEPVTP